MALAVRCYVRSAIRARRIDVGAQLRSIGFSGFASLAVAIGEDAMTLEEVYEPYLIQEGFLQRTARGREATKRAYRRFGFTLPDERKGGPGQASFFGE